MGSESNQINSSASDVLSATASQALADFNQIDSQYGEAAKQSVESIVQSLGADIETADATKPDIIQSLTSKSVTLISSASKQVVLDYANAAISEAVDSANDRVFALASTAQSSAAVALSYFKGSAYGEVSSYATPSEAASGVAAFNSAINSAINNANTSSANVVVNQAVDSLNEKVAVLGDSAADATHSSLADAAHSVINVIKDYADDVSGANTTANSGVAELNSIADSVTVSHAIQSINTVYHRFKHDLNQVNDSIANDTLSALEDVITPAYNHVKSRASIPTMVVQNVNNAINTMNNVFTRYGSQLVAAGIKEYTSNALKSVAYLDDHQLMNAKSMIDSAASAAEESALNVDNTASNAVNQYYGLIPLASSSIKQVTDQINVDYVMNQLDAASSAANSVTSLLASANKMVLDAQIQEQISRFKNQMAEIIEQPATLKETTTSVANQIKSMASAAITADPHASARHAIASAASAANARLANFAGATYSNAASAVNATQRDATQAVEEHLDNDAQLNQIGDQIESKMNDVLSSYAIADAEAKLNAALATAHSLIDQISNGAVQMTAASQVDQLYTDLKASLDNTTDLSSATDTGVSALSATTQSLIASDPSVSAHYAVQVALSSADAKTIYLDSISNDDVNSEIAGITSQASSAMNDDIGNASALSQDVNRASEAADEVVNRYNVNSAQAEMGRLASSAHYEMRHINDSEGAIAASKAVVTIQDSLTATLNRAADRLSTISLAMSSAYSSIDSITARYISGDVAAAAYSNVARVQSSASVVAQDFNVRNQANVSSEVTKQVRHANQNLASTHDHTAVVNQLSQTVDSILNRYTLTNANQMLMAAVDAAMERITSFNLFDDDNLIQNAAQNARNNIDKDMKDTALLQLDLANGLAAIDQAVQSIIAHHNPASAAQYLGQFATQIITERSAAGFDMANFKRLVNKSIRTNQTVLMNVNADSNAVHEITNLAVSEVNSHYAKNVMASATNALSNASDNVKTQLNRFGMPVDDRLGSIVDKYKTLIQQDAGQADFAHLDQVNGIEALNRYLVDTISEQPKADALYQIDQQRSKVDSNAAQYFSDLVAMDREIYRTTSSAATQINQLADDATIGSVVTSANAAVASIGNAHIASAAKAQIESASTSAHARVADIANVGKVIDARNAIDTATKHAVSLVAKDQYEPRVVKTDTRNATSAMDSLAQAAISDDLYASAMATISSLTSSATDYLLAIGGQQTVLLDSEVDELLDSTRADLNDVNDAALAAQKIDAFNTKLTEQFDKRLVATVENQITAATDAAKLKLQHVSDPKKARDAQTQVDQTVSNTLPFSNEDLHDEGLLKTDIDNLLDEINRLVNAQINTDLFAQAELTVESAVAKTVGVANRLSGSAADNMNSEVASANDSYADQLNQTDPDHALEVASQAVETFNIIEGSYIEATTTAAIQNAATRVLTKARAYSAVDLSQLENQIESIVTAGNQAIGEDKNDLTLARLDADNTIEQIQKTFVEAVNENEVDQNQYAIQSYCRSAVAKAGSMDSNAAANISSALNKASLAADGQPSVASSQMDQAINDYYASLAQNQVSTAAKHAHRSVLQLSNVTKVSTSAAINSVVSSANNEINIDRSQPSYAKLDATDGISAINELLDSAIARDSNATRNSVAASATSSAYARIGSLSEHQSLLIENQIQQLVDQNSNMDQSHEQLIDRIDNVANRYLLDSTAAKLDSTVAKVRNVLADSDDQYYINTQMQQIVYETQAKVNRDLKKPAYLSLDMTTAVDALNGLISKYWTDSVAVQQDVINASASALTTTVANQSTPIAQSNVSSAAASVARATNEAIAANSGNDEAIDSLTSAAASQFDQLHHDFVANSALDTIQSAVSSAESFVQVIRNVDSLVRIHEQLNNVADSFKQLIDHDAHSASLATLDANNASLEINRIASQAVANNHLASATVMLHSVADAQNSNAVLMTASQSDNYASAMAKAMTPITNGQLNDKDAQTISQTATSVQTALASVANEYYGQWAHSAVSQAVSELSRKTNNYNEVVQMSAASFAASYQNQFASQFAEDHQSADLIVLDANNAVSAINSAAVSAAENDSIAFANAAISTQISSANSVLNELNGHTDSAADMQMDSVANQANEKLGSVYSNLNAVMMVINSASGAMDQIANSVIASSAHSAVTSAADSLMVKTGQLTADAIQSDLISAIKQNAESVNSQIDANANYPVSVSMATDDGINSMANSTMDQLKQSPAASTAIALDTIASSAAANVGSLTSFASANLSSAVAGINGRTSAYLVGRTDNASQVANEIAYVSRTIDQLMQKTVAQSASEYVDQHTKDVFANLATIQDVNHRSNTANAINERVHSASAMAASDAFDYRLASLDAVNAVEQINQLASAAFKADQHASQSLANQRTLNSAKAKMGSLSSLSAIKVDSQIAALDPNQMAEYTIGLDSIANQFIASSANGVVSAAQDSAAVRTDAIRDVNTKNNLLQMVSDQVNQASLAINSDTNNSMFASLDANNAASAIANLVNDAIDRDPIASASGSIEKAVASITANMSSLNADQQIRFDKQVAAITSSANTSLVGPFADMNTIINDAKNQMLSLANGYTLNSAYGAVDALASSASAYTRDLNDNESMNVKNFIDNAITSANTQISAHSASSSLIADAVNDATHTVAHLASSAVSKSPLAAAKSSLASVAKSATTIADSLTGRNAANFSSAIASCTSQAVAQFTPDDETGNQQALQTAAIKMRNIANFHAAKGAIAEVSAAASTVAVQVARLADENQRSQATTQINDTVDEYQVRIQSDTNQLSLINLDVQNAQSELSSLASAATQHDGVAKATIELDHVASSYAAQTTHFDSLQNANLKSAVRSVTSQATAQMQSTTSDSAAVSRITESAKQQMASVLNDYVVDSATTELDAGIANFNQRIADIDDQQFKNEINDWLNVVQSSAAQMIQKDAYSQSFVQLDLMQASSAIDSAAAGIIQKNPVASVAYLVKDFVSAANSRTAHLTGSSSANFSSAIKSVARQANQAVSGVSDEHALETITVATDNEINSTVNSYLVKSAYHNLQSVNASASAAMQYVDGPAKADAIKALNSTANSAAQMIVNDANDDQLISLDVKDGQSAMAALTSATIASQPIASAYSFITSTASVAMQRVGSLAAFASANMSSALNRFAKQAYTQLNANNGNQNAVDQIQSNMVASIDDVANSYVTSSASELITSATESAYAVINQFDNDQAASTASASIDEALTTVANQFADDRNNASLMALDADNAVDAIHSAAQFITTTDEIASGNIYLSNAAASAYSITAGFGNNALLNKQIQDVLSDTNTQFANGANVELVVTTALEVMDELVHDYFIHTTDQRIADFFKQADDQLNQLLYQHDYEEAHERLIELGEHSKALIQKDAHDGELVKLDLINIEKQFNALLLTLIANNEYARSLNQISQWASAAVQNEFKDVADDDYLNFSSAVNSVVRSFEVNGNANDIKNSVAEGATSYAIASIDSLAQSYVVNQAMTSVTASVKELRAHTKELGNFVTQSSAASAINQIANDAADHILSDNADFGAVSLDTDNAISAANAVFNSAVANDSIADGKRKLSAIYSDADSFAADLDADDAVAFSLAVASQSATVSFGADVDNQTMVASAASGFKSLIDSYVASSANAAINQTASVAIESIQEIKDANKRDQFAGILTNVITDAMAEIDQDNADQSLVDIDVQNNINTINSLADSMVRSDPGAAGQHIIASAASSAMADLPAGDSAAIANFSSAINSVANQASLSVSLVSKNLTLVNRAAKSSSNKMASLAVNYRGSTAQAQLNADYQSAHATVMSISDDHVRSTAIEELASASEYYDTLIDDDAYNAEYVKLDLQNGTAEFNATVASAAKHDPSVKTSLALVDNANQTAQRLAPLGNSVNDNFVSATASLASQTNGFISYANGDNNQISIATSSTTAQFASLADSYVAKSATDAVTDFIETANHSLAFIVDAQVQAEIKQNIAALQRNVKQIIEQDASDDRLLALDVRNAKRQISSLVDWSINDNIYASANAHVHSVADSLTAANPIADRIEKDRLQLSLDRLVEKANRDIKGAGMNNDLINATVESTAALLTSAASQFAVNDAHSQVASLKASAIDALNWFTSQSNQFVADDVDNLASSVDDQINQYVTDSAARQLMVNQGRTTLQSYVDAMIASNPQAVASATVSSNAVATNSVVAQFVGSAQANFNSEVMAVKQSADAVIQQSVNDPEMAASLTSSVAERFTQVVRKYVANSGYIALNQAASSANDALNQFGTDDDQAQAELNGLIREFNSMIDSDANKYATVQLDYQNASLAINSLVAETTVDDSVAHFKWQVQSQANSIANSVGSMGDVRHADNFSSAINSAVLSANESINNIYDDNEFAANHATIQANLNSLTERFISASANDKLSVAYGDVKQLADRFGVTNSVADQLTSIVNDYQQRIQADKANSGFASLDADNASIAMRDLALSMIDQHEVASVDYQLTTAASAFSATAAQFASDDQIRFSSAMTSIVDQGVHQQFADGQHASATVTSAKAQMATIANQFTGRTAMNHIDSMTATINQRIENLHNDIANAVIRSAANSATSAVIAESNNPMATSLAAYDGITTMHSLANSLIAEQPVAFAMDSLNHVVNSMTNDVLMSDSLADMNFLSAVAKQSKQATRAIKAADGDSAIATMTTQAEKTLTSIAHSYVTDSAGQKISAATQSALNLIDTIPNNVARSQATNWVHNQASAAISMVSKDVQNDGLVELDIDNGRFAIQSVADNAANSDANVAFNSLITATRHSADSKTATLSSSLAANYASAVDKTIASITNEHQSLSTLTNSLANMTMDEVDQIASDYLVESATQRIERALSTADQYHFTVADPKNQLSFLHSQIKTTLENDAHDQHLISLDVANALAEINTIVNSAIAEDPVASFESQLSSQANSASAKVGSMNAHSAANFSSTATRIVNDAKHYASVNDNVSAAISSAATTMNELANQYGLSSATASLSSIADSANVKTVAVNNYASVENAISSAASAMHDTIVSGQNYPAVVSLAVSDMRSQADYIVENAIKADPTTSALAVIDRVASSLMSDADLSGHAAESYASIQASVAQSAQAELAHHQDTMRTITSAKQALTQAAHQLVARSADLIVDKALDVANNQAVEISDVHSRNLTISNIGALVNNARELIKAHVNNPFFAYLDAQNAAVEIAKVADQAVQSDAAASAIIATSKAAETIFNSLKPLIDSNEAFRLNNRLSNIVDNTNRMVGMAVDNHDAIASYAHSASDEFASINRRYVADSANAVVTSASDSASIQIEGINDTWNRNIAMTGIGILTDSAATLINNDANHLAYASLDADNASIAISSVAASAIANDPTASANFVISSQIQSAADIVYGMANEEQSAFSNAVMSVAGSANVEFANAADNADQIDNVTSQTVEQLHSVATDYVVVSAKAVINNAASDAHQILNAMFENSTATVYSSVATVINEAMDAVMSDSSNFATVSLDAYNASSAIGQLVKNNENSYAHSLIDSHASAAASTANVLNDSLRPIAVTNINRHASAAHSAVTLHFGHAEATLSDVNSATSAMADIISEYVQQDPVASAHSVVASAAESANAKAANLTDSYQAKMSTAVSSAAAQANTLIAMNPANSLLDSQLASDAASSMNSYVNMYEAAAANEATISYAASAYAQMDSMDDEFKQRANQAVAFEVDNAKQAFAYNADDPSAIFTNVSSAADNMRFLVANYIAQNSSAVADAKQSFAADMDSVTGGVYSQARVLSINNRGQINSLTGSVATAASANVSEATTISSVAATYRRASSLVGSVADVAINFARQTASAELTATNDEADQSLSTMDANAKQSVVASINTLISGVQARISTANNTVDIVNEINSCVARIKRMVESALSANLQNTKNRYKGQIISAATAAYQGVNGLAADAQSLTNAAISMAASDASANIDQTNQLAEIQMLTSAGIASINEASSVAVSNVKTNGNSLIASAANAATGRTTTLSPVDKSAANSVIASLANVANSALNGANNVADASNAITSGTSAINSAVDSTIASVISSAMAMANNLAAQNERDSVRLELKSAADAAYASTASLTPEMASAVNEYVSQTASTVDQRIMDADNDDEVNEIASSAMSTFEHATDSAANIYTESLHNSAASAVDSIANSVAGSADSFTAEMRDLVSQSITAVANQTKAELQSINDANRANNIVQLTVDRLEQLIQQSLVDQLENSRVDAKERIQSMVEQFETKLTSFSATAKQSVLDAINDEATQLKNRVDEADSAMSIKAIADSASAHFDHQVQLANEHAIELSRRAAMQVLTSNADSGLEKLVDVNEVINDSARETINELNTDAFNRINSANTVEQITEITNDTSNNINHVVRESLSMNEKM
ncbi:hypothetical protein ACYATM_04525 [Lactobacillaceae bacterium Scapto_B20]